MTVPFSVRCVSCHGRLRVSDETLVGAIVACPRCGSMVQIAPPSQSESPPRAENPPGRETSPREAQSPAPQSPEARPPATSRPNAPLPSAPAPSAPLPNAPLPNAPLPAELPPEARLPELHYPEAGAPPPSQQPLVLGSEIVDSQEMTQGDLPDEQELSQSSGPSTAPPIQAELASQPSATSLGDGDVSPGPRSEDWQSEENWASETTRQTRKRLFMGVSAVGGLIVIALLAVWGWGSGSSDTQDDDSLAQHPAANDAAVEATQTSKRDVSSSEAIPSPDDEAENTTPSSDAAQERRPDPNPMTPRPSDDATAASDPRESASSGLPAGSDDAPIPADLLPSDVLGNNDQRETTEATPQQPIIAAGANTEAEPAALMDMPPELEAFTRLLELPGNAPDAPPTKPMEKASEDLLLDEAADAMLDPMLLATPPPELNIENALKLRVAIQTTGYPLADFVLVCSEVTQLPIQIDWVTLELAGVSLSQSVQDSRPGWKPIGTLMDTIASEIGLVFEREESKLFLSLSEADTAERLARVHSLDDFESEKEATEAWVTHFVGSTQWNERERLGLRALVIDCLRRARGRASRLSPLSQAHWTASANCLSEKREQDFPEQWPILSGGDAGPQLDTAITLAGLLRQTARVNQTLCVVNWDDARRRRLTPGQLVLPYAGQPAGEMLGETLAPMGLQVRVADEAHWWVGTAATYDRMPLLVIGDPLGPRREQILARIREAAERAGTLLLLEHDPLSDRYLSLMPRFLYRQLPTILKPFQSDSE